jgi:hypothetical protein
MLLQSPRCRIIIYILGFLLFLLYLIELQFNGFLKTLHIQIYPHAAKNVKTIRSNINDILELGHFDESGQYKILPYVEVAQQWKNLSRVRYSYV